MKHFNTLKQFGIWIFGYLKIWNFKNFKNLVAQPKKKSATNSKQKNYLMGHL
jgi:hypothetical protein